MNRYTTKGFKYEADTPMSRLQELEDKIEDGVLIEPPCKRGDTVYRVMRDKRIKQPYKYKVIGFWYAVDDKYNDAHLVRYVNGEFDSSICIPFSEFGSIVFLTKAEAEKVLAERKESESRGKAD